MTTQYQATAVRDGDWWFIEVPEVGAYGQAATLAKAPAVAQEITALWLDVDPASIEVTVTAQVDSETAAAIEKADKLAAKAADMAREAAELRSEAVTQYVKKNKLTRREAAAALGMSPQRVQQLVKP